MKTQLMTAIQTSISEVMETMFFLPVEFGPESTLAESGMDEKKMACELRFTGQFSGHLILMAPEILVAEMAQNFMGESLENITPEHLDGTLTEMLNMVCGNALRKIEIETPFELGIPKKIDGSTGFETQAFTIVETTESKMAILLTTE
jgi:CheY-specific phosphatase CheX